MKHHLTSIGLDAALSKELATKLNTLLANYQILYMNTRSFHWNIKGEKFFELHLKFEELYNNFQIKIDDIAERILTLGETPLHTYAKYIQHADIKEVDTTSDGKECVKLLVDALQIIIVLQREILDLAGRATDEGTNALMSDNIREQEKLIWMYRSFLTKTK
ncbi:MAG: Dps family protein [Bacteroidota bacterium]